jgi:D-serine deaminase-like pyridoxal phosphate-dependent protein
MKEKIPWYEADNVDEYDSPALFIYPERIKANIGILLGKAPAEIFRPHVKTNKIAEVCQLMLVAGIRKFKTATIAETEMLALIKAPDILLAYPPTIPKIKRLIRLVQKYPDTRFSCLVDHPDGAQAISDLFAAANLTASVYIDLNLGMNRTGIVPENAISLYQKLKSLPAIQVLGIHSYDGHLRDRDEEVRKRKVEQAFAPVLRLKRELEKLEGNPLTLIAGGTPTGFIHAAAGDRESSPGTFIFWDKGYAELLPEQNFEWAAVLVSRVISIPAGDMICVDLGHKSVAAENPQPRVFFLNAPDAVPISQSEEHLVLKVPDATKFNPGDVLYGIPWHICPSVALYDKAYVVENNHVTGSWKVIARNREITI